MAYVIQTPLTNSQLSSRASRRRTGRGGVLSRLMAGFQRWRRLMRDREALASLTDRDLADFGATRVDVYQEMARPFWTLPPL